MNWVWLAIMYAAIGLLWCGIESDLIREQDDIAANNSRLSDFPPPPFGALVFFFWPGFALVSIGRFVVTRWANRLTKEKITHGKPTNDN